MKVLVGVCGGIAAYKAAELVRQFQRSGSEVEVAMTAGAERFITPLTFAALTGRSVYTSLWQPSGEATGASASAFEIEHIAATIDLDAVVIAPATANMMAKLAHGIADDFLTTLCLASKAPLYIAPSMNVHMWQHPATQYNLQLLQSRGVRLIAPDDGYLACGMVGDGRLASVEAIVEAVVTGSKESKDLTGETFLITAGGTREPIDPVRFLGNRSSGKMGHALAEAAVKRGAEVHLVTASSLPMPSSCSITHVTKADEMAEAVFQQLDQATVVIGAAAVSDFRISTPAEQKLRRSGPMTLELEPTEDIIAGVVTRRRAGTKVIAFAAETEELEANARRKLLEKGVDAIVANNVSVKGLGFDADRNAGLFITAENTTVLPETSKCLMAEHILNEITKLRRGSGV